MSCFTIKRKSHWSDGSRESEQGVRPKERAQRVLGGMPPPPGPTASWSHINPTGGLTQGRDAICRIQARKIDQSCDGNTFLRLERLQLASRSKDLRIKR